MQLRIRIEEEGTRRVVHLSGECDMATAPQLREALLPLRGPEVGEVLVEASELEFMDSTGLGVLIGCLKRLRESGGSLKIVGAGGPVRRVLQITGIDQIIPLHDSLEAAKD